MVSEATTAKKREGRSLTTGKALNHKMTKEAYMIAKRVIENSAQTLGLDSYDIRRILSGNDAGWQIRGLVELAVVAALESSSEDSKFAELRAAIEAKIDERKNRQTHSIRARGC